MSKIPANSATIRSSSTTTSTATPTQSCSSRLTPQIPPDVHNFTLDTAYCQFSWPERLDKLEKRCCGGNELFVYDNCTQFCETNSSKRAWGDCVRTVVPDAEPPFGYACKVTVEESEDAFAEKPGIGWGGIIVVGLGFLAALGV